MPRAQKSRALPGEKQSTGMGGGGGGGGIISALLGATGSDAVEANPANEAASSKLAAANTQATEAGGEGGLTAKDVLSKSEQKALTQPAKPSGFWNRLTGHNVADKINSGYFDRQINDPLDVTKEQTMNQNDANIQAKLYAQKSTIDLAKAAGFPPEQMQKFLDHFNTNEQLYKDNITSGLKRTISENRVAGEGADNKADINASTYPHDINKAVTESKLGADEALTKLHLQPLKATMEERSINRGDADANVQSKIKSYGLTLTPGETRLGIGPKGTLDESISTPSEKQIEQNFGKPPLSPVSVNPIGPTINVNGEQIKMIPQRSNLNYAQIANGDLEKPAPVVAPASPIINEPPTALTSPVQPQQQPKQPYFNGPLPKAIKSGVSNVGGAMSQDVGDLLSPLKDSYNKYITSQPSPIRKNKVYPRGWSDNSFAY